MEQEAAHVRREVVDGVTRVARDGGEPSGRVLLIAVTGRVEKTIGAVPRRFAVVGGVDPEFTDPVPDAALIPEVPAFEAGRADHGGTIP